MKEFAIAGANLRRTFRERTSFFFLFLFPILMILILGAAFGGNFKPRVGVFETAAPLSDRLVAALRAEPGIAVVSVSTQEDLVASVERGELEAALILPADTNSPVRFVVRPGLQGQQVGSIVTSVLNRESGRLRAATFVQAETGTDPVTAQARTDATAQQISLTPTIVTPVGSDAAPVGRFDAMASGELLLFVFLIAMTNSVALIETRRLGVSRRMASTPTSTGTIVRGEALGRLCVSLLQALVIMAGSALLFDVSWGDPFAAALLVLAFTLVAGAAGLLMGTIARNPSMAVGIGLLTGLTFGALGGAMMPLELFSPAMLRIAHFTPHAWAADGFATLIARNGNVTDIIIELGILFGTALVLYTVGAWALRRQLTR